MLGEMIWANNAKGEISTTAQYDRVVQEILTSMRDRADLEAGRRVQGITSRRGTYQRSELYQTGKRQVENSSTKKIVMMKYSLWIHQATNSLWITTALETYFDS